MLGSLLNFVSSLKSYFILLFGLTPNNFFKVLLYKMHMFYVVIILCINEWECGSSNCLIFSILLSDIPYTYP